MRLLPAILISLTLLSSCSLESRMKKRVQRAERKIEKLTIKYPTLLQKDTITDTITLVSREVKLDTSFITIAGDTTYLYKDKLSIKYVRTGDTVHIEGKCKSDTITQTVKIPFEKIVIQEQGIVKQITNNLKVLLIVLILFVLLVLLVRTAWKIIK